MNTTALGPVMPLWPETTIGSELDIGWKWVYYRAMDTSVTRGFEPRELLERIAIASALAQRDNWDREGGRAVDLGTVKWAEVFASSLPSSLPLPDVEPDLDGDLSFQWFFAPDRVVTASVRRDGAVSYAALVKASRAHGWTSLSAGVPREVTDWVARARNA